MAEENVLPSSGGEVLDRAGIKDSGYLRKKGTPSGMEAKFNELPPGMNIDDQKLKDFRLKGMIIWSGGLSYPGDGW